MPTVSDRSIRMLEATGRVKIEKEDGRATCRKAVYYEAEKKIILTGDPVAWQKGTRVSGKRIIMFLEEDRSVVEGDSQVIIEGEGGGQAVIGTPSEAQAQVHPQFCPSRRWRIAWLQPVW